MNPTKTKPDPNALDGRTGLVRGLSRADGVPLVVGTVIGSGIFLVPGPIAGQLHSLTAVLLVWAVGGLLSFLLSLSGALSLGELGAMYPGAGGLYVYLRHAFGRPLAFLYGWGLLSMIQTGSITTLAVGFGLYLSRLAPLSRGDQKATAIVCILLLTGVNWLWTRPLPHGMNRVAEDGAGGDTDCGCGKEDWHPRVSRHAEAAL
jgi:APA family basic amino acid/polyamine antiporter